MASTNASICFPFCALDFIAFGNNQSQYTGPCLNCFVCTGYGPSMLYDQPSYITPLIILVISVAAIAYGAYNYKITMDIPVVNYGMSNPRAINDNLVQNKAGIVDTGVNKKVAEICSYIKRGARAFLFAEYKILFVFLAVFSIAVFLAVGAGTCGSASGCNWVQGVLTAIAFALGGITSIVCGFIGMSIAVEANGRVALQAQRGYAPAFKTAFQAALVMGFSLCGLGLLVLYILILLYRLKFGDQTDTLYDTLAGYGFGGSSVALFARVGGGIYTKAADVGADLVGKVEQGIPEDDPRNPAVIADNVGDNVGDIAGMGADLFGSFAESTCAALVIGGNSIFTNYTNDPNAMAFPLMISASGIVACFFTSLLSTHVMKVNRQPEIERTLKVQMGVSGFLESLFLIAVVEIWLPDNFCLSPNTQDVTTKWDVFACAMSGLWAGVGIGFVTEYFTSHSYSPVRDVAGSCRTGAATNIIYGLALGYKSVVVPILLMAGSIGLSFTLAGMYGVACAALGVLSTLVVSLTIDGYGPISDNAGGIAEMAGLGEAVRERTDALDAAGNTTAAIGKGFAIASAAMVSLALFGAFVTRVQNAKTSENSQKVLYPNFNVDILKPMQFAGLLVGAMLPYFFSAMTMKSVGKAALAMVEEVRRQFREIPGIMEGTEQPDYERCVAISTNSSLKEMIPPAILVMGAPILVGFLAGVECLAGLLAGGLVSGVQIAISASNTGGAWDNAKKYIEAGNHGGKGSDPHKAAVVGDTVGDPLKDTSGPSLNILMKLMAVESLVLSPFFIYYSVPTMTGHSFS